MNSKCPLRGSKSVGPSRRAISAPYNGRLLKDVGWLVRGQHAGRPPWSCTPIEACNAESICAPLHGVPLGFNLRAVENEKNKFVLDGSNGATRIVLLFPNIEDAQRFVGTDNSETGASIILIRNTLISDTHSFWAHSVVVRGTGQYLVRKDKMLVACNNVREK